MSFIYWHDSVLFDHRNEVDRIFDAFCFCILSWCQSLWSRLGTFRYLSWMNRVVFCLMMASNWRLGCAGDIFEWKTKWFLSSSLSTACWMSVKSCKQQRWIHYWLTCCSFFVYYYGNRNLETFKKVTELMGQSN